MGIIRRSIPWTRQPTDAFRINRGHPLAANLAAAWYMGGSESHLIDALDDLNPLEVTGLNRPTIEPGSSNQKSYTQTATGTSEVSADHGRFRRTGVPGNSPLGLADANECTIIARIRPRSSATSFGRIIDKGTGGDGAGGYSFYTGAASSTLVFAIDGNNDALKSNNNAITFDGTVYVVSIRYSEATSALRAMRVDGVDQLLSNLTFTFPTAATDLAIGNWNRTDSNTSRRFIGEIDYVLLFDKAIPIQQIAALERNAWQIFMPRQIATVVMSNDIFGIIKRSIPWHRQPPRGTSLNRSHPLTRGLVGCWVGDDLIDKARSALMVRNNDVTTGQGIKGRTFAFKNTTQPDYLSIADERDFDISGECTLVSLFRGEDAVHFTNRGLFGKYLTTGNQRSYQVMIDFNTDNNNPRVATGFSPDGTFGAAIEVSGTTILVADRWYLVGGSFKPSTHVKLFLDGVQEGINTTSIPSAIFNSTTDLTLGLTSGVDEDQALQGQIALSLLYDRDLSNFEHAALAANPWRIFEPRKILIPTEALLIGVISAALPMSFAIGADLKAKGKLDATLATVYSISADLKAKGKLDATLATVYSISADLKAKGKLNAVLPFAVQLVADLKASGKLDSTLPISFGVAANLQAIGKLDAALNVLFNVVADLKAKGKLDATLATVFAVAADLKAKGKLDAALAIVFNVVADLGDATGGQIDAVLPMAFSVAADLKAQGKLDAALPIDFSLVADLKALGELDAQLPVAFSVIADLKALGKFDAALPVVFSVIADLTQIGKLDAVLPIAFSVVADLKAKGQLDAALPIVFAVSADLKAQGKLDAALPMIFSVLADLKARGQLNASLSIAFGVAANLTATGQLAASANIAFNIVANLIDATFSALILSEIDLIGRTIAVDLEGREITAQLEGRRLS